jgi:hypothetical protein
LLHSFVNANTRNIEGDTAMEERHKSIDELDDKERAALDKHIDEAVTEIVEHMQAEGESLYKVEDSMAGMMFEKSAKLIQKAGSDTLVLVTNEEDWIHDALDDMRIFYGTVYAEDEPFAADTTSIDGYFQDEESGRWIHLSAGNAIDDGDAWKDSLEDFPEVVEQFDRCMQIPEYQHLVEKATMINMARGKDYDE